MKTDYCEQHEIVESMACASDPGDDVREEVHPLHGPPVPAQQGGLHFALYLFCNIYFG
jgi:hypothetical protein